MNIEIIEKLQKTEFSWDDWSMEDKKQLLILYSIISRKEYLIFQLIYQHHGCDSWEDIFRNYDPSYLLDKARGVDIAIKSIVLDIGTQGSSKTF